MEALPWQLSSSLGGGGGGQISTAFDLTAGRQSNANFREIKNQTGKGDCHLQKTYLPDFLSPHRIKNEGQADSWYVEDSHAGIVSRETFEMVQLEFKNRQELRSTGMTGSGKFSGKYPFSGMIVCGECGETYRRHQQYSKKKKYYIWVCKQHENIGKDSCPAKPIKESALQEAFIRAVNRLMTNSEEILEEIKRAAESEVSDGCDGSAEELAVEMDGHQEAIMELLKKETRGAITEKEYEDEVAYHKNRLDGLALKRETLLTNQSKMQLAKYRTDAIVELLQNGHILQKFDRVIFKSLVRKMKVINGKEVEIEFECGIKIRETVK